MAVKVAESYVTVAGIMAPEASSSMTVDELMVAGFMFSLKGTRMLDPALTPVEPFNGYARMTRPSAGSCLPEPPPL